MLKYVLPGRTYTNIKTSNPYQVFQVGNHSEAAENMVVYVDARSLGVKHQLGLFFLRLASQLIEGKVWVRPLELFKQKFRE